ncbi:MAG: VOC family protein [Pseudomonadota bacterium]|nr:VOC family protein [Pseudomonadota bacterium]
MSAVTELGYIAIGVSDLAAWKEFAAQVIGMEVVPGDAPKSCYLRMDYWHYRIRVEEDGTDDIRAAGWRVADIEDLDRLERRVREASIPCKRASDQESFDHGVLGLLTLSDPAGMPLEIFYGPRVEPGIPVYPGRRMHGRFVTDGGGFGHLVCRQPDLKKSEYFYKHCLGMKGSIGSQSLVNGKRRTAVFMNCNSRQHSLAFIEMSGGKLLNHLMTEVSCIEDVGLSYDIVKARKIPVVTELGQHNNDRALSFYCRTPSGWSWEVGAGVIVPSAQAEFATRDVWGHQRIPMPGSN